PGTRANDVRDVPRVFLLVQHRALRHALGGEAPLRPLRGRTAVRRHGWPPPSQPRGLRCPRRGRLGARRRPQAAAYHVMPWVADDPFGIGVVDVRERAEVEAMLAEDPAITSGAMQAEIRPMRIVTR